jgi:uncharacterized phage protein gp47/JayE
MADLELKSERQIQNDILAVLIAELGLNDINRGSVVDVLTRAVAQEQFSLYYQIAQVSRLADIEAITGDDLDLKAFEYGLTRRESSEAKGVVTIKRAEGFEKVSTTFYAGSPSPIAGDTLIDVNDASNPLIGTSGTLIIGRGTNNEEEVTYSTAPINNLNFFRFNLDAPLNNDHALEETVILKQGSDETVLAGTTVVVPATGTSPEIRFSIDNDVTLLSGEAEVTNVGVTALEPGTDGNIPVGAIKGVQAFPNPPFPGARATNESKFTTGQDRETDDELRDRIKDAIPALSRGVKQAIQNAIVGLVDVDSAKRVVSASIILPEEEAGDVKVYIDDGTGFEPTFVSQGFETILRDSTGGERRLQIDNFPIAKAQVESNNGETYDLSAVPLTLDIEVGTLSETITFNASDFRFPDIATAEEVVTAINNKSTLVEARTSNGGTFVVISAKVDENESLQVTGGSANSVIGFPTDRKNTLNLYLDDILLSKDGATATLDSGNSAPFNLQAVGAYPHDLDVVVDGKSANTQTASIALSDVADPANVTVEEIATVINRDIAGLTAFGINSDSKLRLESNTKLSSNSKIEVTGGTMNDATDGLNFSTTEVSGIDGDYTFNRELGIVELSESLGVNKTVTAGSLFTRGKLRASSPELYSPANGETLVISVDGGANQTVTFDTTFTGGKTAEQTALFINDQLEGATAIVREIGGQNFLEINTNTYEVSGSIEIKSASTANSSFGFDLDTVNNSADPNKAFKVSGNSGPYEFAENDNLVVVLDNDIQNSTFSVNMNYVDAVTGGTSTTVFESSGLTSIFLETDEIEDYYAAFTSGANTTSGGIESVSDEGGGTFRYTFDTAPTDLANYAAGDLVKITDLDDSDNNTNAVITAVGASYFEITNPDGVSATLQTGNAVLSQRRQVTTYDEVTGEITVGTAFSNTPANGDDLIVIPSTVQNLVEYMNNTKITSISLKADVSGVENNSKVQISSKKDGSDGYVQITGGSANDELDFNSDLIRGVQAYNYWTGLLELVHRTIYGDDENLESFPGVGAAGITFRVLAPTVTQVSVEMNVTLREGISIASLENEIKSAVSGYINSLGVGEDVIIEEIRAAVINISGITDVDLSVPENNIPVADNEIARVSDPDILIG